MRVVLLGPPAQGRGGRRSGCLSSLDYRSFGRRHVRAAVSARTAIGLKAASCSAANSFPIRLWRRKSASKSHSQMRPTASSSMCFRAR